MVFFEKEYLSLARDQRVAKALDTALEFQCQRDRPWSIMFFTDASDVKGAALSMLKQKIREYGEQNFISFNILYSGRCTKAADQNNQMHLKCFYFESLYAYLATHDSVRLSQAVLTALPRANMQRYFREKEQSQNAECAPDSAKVSIYQIDHCTSDVYGKVLKNFERRSGTGEEDNEVPLLFYLLTGYFRANQERMQTVGLFRITASDSKVKELELHMS